MPLCGALAVDGGAEKRRRDLPGELKHDELQAEIQRQDSERRVAQVRQDAADQPHRDRDEDRGARAWSQPRSRTRVEPHADEPKNESQAVKNTAPAGPTFKSRPRAASSLRNWPPKSAPTARPRRHRSTPAANPPAMMRFE